tara:strand:+ start:878 stop:1570 length:693 start_codon:yes stop_codon:yes gene_type:complete
MEIVKKNLITDSDVNNLKNENYVHDLICKLGFNNEALHEQPDIVKNNMGGLKIWQYPNQFSKYLLFLQKFKIESYLEIGVRHGGTFVLTNEYLKKFNNVTKSVAVDVSINEQLTKYCKSNPNMFYLHMDSHREDFKEYMTNNKFDLIFIDGDHSYDGVKADYELCKHNSDILVFHDISNKKIGPKKLWKELKRTTNEYDFYEFIDQYEEVFKKTGRKYLGIGVAVKKSSN